MRIDDILYSSVAGVATPAWLAGVVLLLCISSVVGLPLARPVAAPDATLLTFLALATSRAGARWRNAR